MFSEKDRCMSEDREKLAIEVRAVRQSSVGWHIQRLAGQLDMAMNAALEPHGLTIQQFAIVMSLVESEGLTQREVGSRFRAPAYAISRSIDGLEADGFVERRPHPTSRRTNTVHATEKSLALVPVLIVIIRDVNARLLETLNENQQANLLGTLADMLDENSL